jgi:hypothetical protein
MHVGTAVHACRHCRVYISLVIYTELLYCVFLVCADHTFENSIIMSVIAAASYSSKRTNVSHYTTLNRIARNSSF